MKRKIFNHRKVSTIFALILTISMMISMFALQGFANAAATAVTTYPFVEAVPNPVGVGQTTLINFGLLNYLMVDGDGWNVTLIITAPDGTNETIGPLKTWSTGTVGYSFTPDTNGTYYLTCVFEESWYNSTYVSLWGGTQTISQLMAASESDLYELVVTTDPVTTYPGHALPSEYWSRPIDSQLREWYSVSGSWVTTPNNLVAENNDAPETAHILWTQAIGDTMGGLVGGETQVGYQNGDAYEGKWASSVIISGVLYYNRYTSAGPKQEVVAVDLHTGEQLWEKVLDTNGRIAFGQILLWDCLNNRGGFSYLWVSSGTSLYAFEASTGDWLYNYTNVPSGTNYYGPNGEFLRYSITGNSVNGYRLLRWNSSYVVNQGKTGMSESWGSQVQGKTFDASTGYDLNVSISGTIPSTSILTVYPGDRVIGGNYTLGSSGNNGVTLWGLSLASGSEGAVLFSNTWTAPSDWANLATGMQSNFVAYSQDDYVAAFWAKEERITYGFSLETGKLLWTTEAENYADAWTDSPADEKNIAYGKLYSASVAGIVYCYDVETGETLWNYSATDPYTESYITNNWWLMTTFISDGKIYIGTMEHSALEPKPRGAPFICLNAETGELVWEIDGAFRQTRWGGRAIIGDSIMVTQDTYDQQIYAVGKGASQTTANQITSAIEQGSSVVISGTVTDISPGTTDSSITLRFPNGVPAISDESMSEWMLYVYKQFEQPTDATGVPVSIDAVDPNGNYVHLGDTTTDSSGYYSLMVTPELTGKYTVYVTFAGTDGYYGSYALTSFGVDQTASSPSPTAISFDAVNNTVTTSILAAGIAIIVAVAVVGLLVLRKK